MGIFAPFSYMEQKVAGYEPSDSDAIAFLTATGITDPTISEAINNLVIDLKAASLWTPMAIIYPFVGGTATTHKYNLKDPQDTDAAYRLTIPGTYTHSSAGMIPDNSTLADSHFVPSTYWANNSSAAMGFYSPNSPTGTAKIAMGCDVATGFNILSQPYSPTLTYQGRAFQQLIQPATALAANTGLTTISRNGVNSLVLYYEGTAMASNTTTETSTTRPTNNLTVGGLNGSFQRTDQTFSFAFVSNGLSATNVSDLATAVQTFQTTLGREV